MVVNLGGGAEEDEEEAEDAWSEDNGERLGRGDIWDEWNERKYRGR
jgi:hypothetical protein